MCMDHAIVCSCGRNEANFNFRNDIMPPETIRGLYCPVCSGKVDYQSATMVRDNGWMIDFDMDVAGLYKNKMIATDKERLSPEVLFDEGYITWRGVYPGDHIDSVNEREALKTMAKINPKKYFEEMKHWANDRMARLKSEGWRKAYDG